MMSLEIFVTVCISFGLVQSDQVLAKQEKGVLQCPTCIGMGSDVELQCVQNTTIKSCVEPRPLCVQISKPGLLGRLCWSEAEFFEFSKGHCQSEKGCQAVKLSASRPAPQKPLNRGGRCFKPSANIQGGVEQAKDYTVDQVITAWDRSDHLNSHTQEGFKYANGRLTVPFDGRYYVYVQIHFTSRPANNKNRVMVYAGNRVLLMIHEDMAANQQKTVFTAGVFQLKAGDKIYVKVVFFDTTIFMGPNHSYFGSYLVSRCRKRAIKSDD